MQEVANAVAEIVQRHLGFRRGLLATLSRPEAPVMGVGVKASTSIAIAKTANHFRAVEIPGRLGIGGCWLG